MKNLNDVINQLQNLYTLLEKVTTEDGYLPIDDIMVLEKRKNDVAKLTNQLIEMRY